MDEKESINKDNNNERIARILTTEEYEQINKNRENAEKMQYSPRVRFRASILEIYLTIPIVIMVAGLIPCAQLVFNFEWYSWIALIVWCISAYIGFLIGKYLIFEKKEILALIDKKENPEKYRE